MITGGWWSSKILFSTHLCIQLKIAFATFQNYCWQALRNHFLGGRLRDLMFGGPTPRTPCPICRYVLEIAQSTGTRSRTASEFLPDSCLRKCHVLTWFGFSVLPAIDKLINIEPDAFVPKTISDENLWSLVQRDLLHGDVCRLATGSNTIPFQLFYIYFTYIWFLFNIYITAGAGSNTILFHLFNSFEFGAYFGWLGLNLEASRHFKF